MKRYFIGRNFLSCRERSRAILPASADPVKYKEKTGSARSELAGSLGFARGRIIRIRLLTILLYCLAIPALYSDPLQELKETVLDNQQDIWGWCTREKALRIIDLVLEVKPKLYVEVGVFGGASLYPALMTLQFLGEGMAVAIDPWDKLECIRYLDPERNKADLKWWADQKLDHIYYGFLNVLRQFELQKTCLILRMTSKKAAAAIGTIDILFLDGNHYEKVAEEDVRLYLPKVRPGGYIWLNDASWTSLQPARELLSQACDVIESVDNGNCLLFRKKR